MALSYFAIYRDAICIAFSHDYKTLRHSTGHKCPSRDWSKKNEQILPSSKLKDKDRINRDILRQKKEIDDIIEYAIEQYGEPKVDKIKELIINPPPNLNKKSKGNLLDLLEEFISENPSGRTNKIHGLKSHLTTFIADKNTRPQDVDAKFLNDFEAHLRQTNGDNSSKKYFIVLKGFFKYLRINKGYKENEAVRNKNIKGKEPFFVVLTKPQLDDLISFAPQTLHEQTVKNIFLILIYTGLA